MRVKSSILLVCALMMTLSACGVATNNNSELDNKQDPIINGEFPDEPMHAAVVSLHQRVGDTWYANIYCSGTLIAPDVVLTAAHCLDEGRNSFNPIEPEDVVIYVGDNPMTDPSPAVYIVTQVQAHPAYNNRALTDDIGLLRLASSPGVTPVAALPASLGLTAADEGAVINFAGFGEDENGNYDQKLQIDGVLDHLYSAFQIYYFQNDGGPCFGDSGGPAFIKRGGTPYVAGLTSYGDSYCAQYGISTRPDYYDGWISDFVGVIPDPYCGDNTCDADEDCSNCPADCGACPPDCSADGWCNPDCDAGADPDCVVDPYCGDGTCDADEDCNSCPADCGACPPNCSSDGWCNPDCDAGADPDCVVEPYCGDGTCDADEDCNSCEADCGPCQTCTPYGGYCDSHADCCSNRCHPRKHYCK